LLCGGLVETGDSGDELYGFFWVGLTYVIILGVAANLNEYFILPQGYKFENTLMLMSIGLSTIFQLLGVFVYGVIVKCLNSQLTFIQVHFSNVVSHDYGVFLSSVFSSHYSLLTPIFLVACWHAPFCPSHPNYFSLQ
jgi:hypothetical protein